jgi:hypothetical protein
MGGSGSRSVRGGGDIGRGTHCWSGNWTCFNVNVGTRGVPLVAVKLPAPLHDKVSRLQILRQIEAITARPDISVLAPFSAILVIEFSNDVTQELKLGGVLLRVDFGQSNCHGFVLLTRDGMIFCRPANTELSAGHRDSLGTSLTTSLVLAIVRSRDWISHSLICTGFLALLAIRACQRVVGIRVIYTLI